VNIGVAQNVYGKSYEGQELYSGLWRRVAADQELHAGFCAM
jgi:hypothetical protein